FFLASIFASPLACGAAGVPRKTTLVEPPPTSYPTALTCFLTTLDSGIRAWSCASTRLARTDEQMEIVMTCLTYFIVAPKQLQLAFASSRGGSRFAAAFFRTPRLSRP